MNITPLIDVVFLLIIFFMLVSNIIAEESIEMIVPDLEEPQTYELEAETLTVSVPLKESWVREDRDEAPLAMPGEAGVVRLGALRDFPSVHQLDGLTDLLKEAKAENPEVGVILRADSAVYYGDVQKVYKAIAEAGIGTVHMVALLEGE